MVLVNDELLTEFQNKMNMFETSFTNVTRDLLNKLESLAEDTKKIAESTAYLKRLKESYDQSNKRLSEMDETIAELMSRLEKISQAPIDLKKKKKKSKKE